jgi:hypothetical protein
VRNLQNNVEHRKKKKESIPGCRKKELGRKKRRSGEKDEKEISINPIEI